MKNRQSKSDERFELLTKVLETFIRFLDHSKIIRYKIIYVALCLFILTGCSDYSETSQENCTQSIALSSEVKQEQKASSKVTTEEASNNISSETITTEETYTLLTLPQYDGRPFVEINQNIPYFTEDELTTEPFESYSALDSLGRCQTAYANICEELMPTEKRGEIGMIRPSGWHTVKYEGIDGNYLYNRCHLIAFQLAGENDNEKNLITGTRSMNTEMIPFENKIADYVKETEHHVLYRVTPVYEEDNLLATGVLLEARSVEDDEICFNVFIYNVQDGIEIDYANGESETYEDVIEKAVTKDVASMVEGANESLIGTGAPILYILNTNTMKFHKPECSSVDTIKDNNKEEYYGNREDLMNKGYEPCKRCNP